MNFCASLKDENHLLRKLSDLSAYTQSVRLFDIIFLSLMPTLRFPNVRRLGVIFGKRLLAVLFYF